VTFSLPMVLRSVLATSGPIQGMLCTATHSPPSASGAIIAAEMRVILILDRAGRAAFAGVDRDASFIEVSWGALPRVLPLPWRAVGARGSAAWSLMMPHPYDMREKWQMFWHLPVTL